MIDPFVYQPPNDVTRPKYAAIREAESFAASEISEVVLGGPVQRLAHYDKAAAFDDINAATKAMHDAIAATCPASADTSAALRCVRLARMLANEAVVFDPDRPRLVRLAIDQLMLARMQACAAIALAGS